MDSSKDTFEAGTFGAISFLCGTFRGIGTATATLVGQWSKVIACHSDQPRIVLHGGSGQLELQGGSDTVEVGG